MRGSRSGTTSRAFPPVDGVAGGRRTQPPPRGARLTRRAPSHEAGEAATPLRRVGQASLWRRSGYWRSRIASPCVVPGGSRPPSLGAVNPMGILMASCWRRSTTDTRAVSTETSAASCSTLPGTAHTHVIPIDVAPSTTKTLSSRLTSAPGGRRGCRADVGRPLCPHSTPMRTRPRRRPWRRPLSRSRSSGR